jgi:hypothetical protein
MRHHRASVFNHGAFDVLGHGLPNCCALHPVRRGVRELVQPARLELPLLDPQVAHELGMDAAHLLDEALRILAPGASIAAE